MELNILEKNIFEEFIKNSLIYYNNQKYKYTEFKGNVFSKVYINEIVITNNSRTISNNFPYEILAIFNEETHIWTWSWANYNINSELTIIAKELLNYGLKIEHNNNNINMEQLFIKSLLVNSKILIKDDIELTINLAVISSLLKNKIKFIHELKLDKDNFNDKIINILIIK